MLKLGLLLLILPPLALMAGYMMEQAEVDACLDTGGAWNYLERLCVQSAESGNLPFVPFMQRYPIMVNGGMLLAVLGLVFCMVGLYRGRT